MKPESEQKAEDAAFKIVESLDINTDDKLDTMHKVSKIIQEYF